MLMRQPAKRNPRRQNIVRSRTIPAPIEGWDASTALAAMKATRAVQLKNWFPQPGYVEMRRGNRPHAWDIGTGVKVVSAVDTGTDTLTATAHGLSDGDIIKLTSTGTLPGGLLTTRDYYVINSAANTLKVSLSQGGSAVDITSAGSGTISLYELSQPAVETLALWQGPASSAMFAAAGGAMWGVTANQAATLSYVSTGGSNRWQWCNHTTSAGQYLVMANGADAMIHYNGTVWAAPSITGIASSANVVQVVTHKKRLWMVLRDSTQAAYLATEAVAGAATVFEFGSLFTKGGFLQAVATWTRDGGSGSDDYFVAISSRGQVALYAGTDPADAATWALVGLFDVPTPIGRRCFQRFGSDLVLITVEGVYPLSQLLAVDQSQVRRVAISDEIAAAFNAAALSYKDVWGWEVCTYPKGTRLLVNVPVVETEQSRQFVMNTLTGAWCEFDGHNGNTWVVYNDNLFFAGNTGEVFQADIGRSDDGVPITAIGQTAYSALGVPNLKRFSMLRPLITANSQNRPSLGISTDFVETGAMSSLTAALQIGTAVWDTAVWDTATWSIETTEVNDWINVVGIGTFGSIKFQAQTGIGSQSSGGWGIARWGTDTWGSFETTDEVMRIHGFVALAEVGEHL